MDGVIVDSMKHHAYCWKTILGQYGMNVQDMDIFRREGMTGIVSVEDIFKEKGVRLPDESAMRELISRKHVMFEKRKIEVYPHVKEILSYLYNKNIKLALVTGSLRRSVTHSIPVDILSLFKVLITSEDVSKGKPDPEPYLKALEFLGAKRENSLVVENAPMGIISAKSAGLNCFAIETTLGSAYLSQADAVFHDHCSLLDYFKSGTYQYS